MTNKNEPAFPRPFSGTKQYAQEGMTLRDYFAAKAMQAMVQNSYFDTTARLAYDVADAMLKAREK